MGFFDFLKKGGGVKDDAKEQPLDEDEQQRQLSDPDNKMEHTPRDDNAENSDSYGESE